MDLDPTTTDFIKASVAAFARHSLTTVAGYLVAKGALASDQGSSFVTIASGVIVWAVGYLWSLYNKKGAAGIKSDFTKMVSHLSRVTPLPPTLPQASSINAAIEVAKKAA